MKIEWIGCGGGEDGLRSVGLSKVHMSVLSACVV